MIFSLVSSAQEWLNVKWDDHKKEEECRAEQKLKELEEIERVCLCNKAIKFCILLNFIRNVKFFIDFL